MKPTAEDLTARPTPVEDESAIHQVTARPTDYPESLPTWATYE